MVAQAKVEVVKDTALAQRKVVRELQELAVEKLMEMLLLALFIASHYKHSNRRCYTDNCQDGVEDSCPVSGRIFRMLNIHTASMASAAKKIRRTSASFQGKDFCDSFRF